MNVISYWLWKKIALARVVIAAYNAPEQPAEQATAVYTVADMAQVSIVTQRFHHLLTTGLLETKKPLRVEVVVREDG